MEIQIPSPSVFLKKSPTIRPQPDPPPVKKPAKARTNTNPKPSKTAVAQNTAQDAAIQKPKQSKSRNGCMTCKKKRLKCDETKPTCQQCAKRNVECEGYKKDYKWRSFDEASVPKTAPKPKKNHSRSHSFTPTAAQPRPVTRVQSQDDHAAPSSSWSPGHALGFGSRNVSQPEDQEVAVGDEPPDPLSPDLSNLPPLDLPDDGSNPYSLPNTSHVSFEDDFTGRSVGSVSISPQLDDLALPANSSRPPQANNRSRSPASFEQMLNEDRFDQGAIQPSTTPPQTINPNDTRTFGPFRQPSPALSDGSGHSSASNQTLMALPPNDPGSPESLVQRYDRQTCGIMSVKDGPNENPWRNLIWPMARDSTALRHAIYAMTAFHGRHDIQRLGHYGVYHMRKALRELSGGIHSMPLDARLATTLVLAFSDGWDRSVVTGIQHLRGAKAMIGDVIMHYRNDLEHGQLSIPDMHKWRFLCNTYVYMDVTSRLTSMEKSDNNFIDTVIDTVNQPLSDLLDVDPLLGCGVGLFSLLGRTVDLVQAVRRSNKMGLTIMSQAIELKEQLEQWQTPNASMFERPQDRTSDVAHSIQTADAIRWAMLLYLHQAIPEMPCPPVEVLARKVLMLLAGIPRTSRTMVIQIFPLLAAGCEAESQEDRDWVLQRWGYMRDRLRIGKIETCLDITCEVWRRRDEVVVENQARMMRFAHNSGQQRNPSTGSSDFSPPNFGGNSAALRQNDTDDGMIFGMTGDFDDAPSRSGQRSPMKRRVTFDAMPVMIPSPTGLMSGGNTNNVNRRAGEDFVVDKLEFDYTIKGRLHWLGVMMEQDWEAIDLETPRNAA